MKSSIWNVTFTIEISKSTKITNWKYITKFELEKPKWLTLNKNKDKNVTKRISENIHMKVTSKY